MSTSGSPNPSGHDQPPEKRSRATYEEEGKDDSASVESVSRDRGGGMLDGDERRQISRRANVDDDDDNYADYDDNDDNDDLSVVTFTNDDTVVEDCDEQERDDVDHNSMDRRHYRNMDLDKESGTFFYKDGTDIDAQEGIPAVDEYQKKSPRDMKEVRVSFGLAREVMLATLIHEYDTFHQKCRDLNIPLEIENEGLYQHLFGEESRLVTAMKRDLKLDHPTIYEFLATFYFAAEFRSPAKRLQEHSRVNYDGYMDQEPLNKIWRAIADAGKNGESPVYFWQDVESALNEDCREFFLTFSGQRHPIRVAWDDDKVHLQFSTHDVRSDPHFLCGGQAHQHTMSNCRGLTIHSAILAASGFPVGFRTSRQGESEHQCYETLLRFMFAYYFTVSGAAHLGLDSIIFCSDRGYWTPALILLILSFGGTVFGTIKRSYWVPFTYNQKRQDKREQIETKYGRSIFVAFSRWGEYMLKIMAWRGGTGNVSLAMNSDCSEDQLVTMEFKLKNSADAKWYHDKDLTRDQRKLKAFQQISGIDISKEDLDKVDAHIQHSLNVVMLTCTDLDFMWFTLRMFAITSSSSVASIKRAAPHIPPTAPNRPAFVNVLGYSGLLSHLGSLNRTSASTSSDEEDDEDGLAIDAALVSKMVKLMRRPTQNIANQCADFAGQIKDAVGNGSLVDATMQAMLVELGINRDRAIKTPRRHRDTTEGSPMRVVSKNHMRSSGRQE
mmetsp:Transcript_33522/g.68063  ORF Transcript_33522/g.68063 Transcript_33522/m.68063 type:complete len:723 (+) Transcript_33522:227-2395(+)